MFPPNKLFSDISRATGLHVARFFQPGIDRFRRLLDLGARDDKPAATLNVEPGAGEDRLARLTGDSHDGAAGRTVARDREADDRLEAAGAAQRCRDVSSARLSSQEAPPGRLDRAEPAPSSAPREPRRHEAQPALFGSPRRLEQPASPSIRQPEPSAPAAAHAVSRQPLHGPAAQAARPVHPAAVPSGLKSNEAARPDGPRHHDRLQSGDSGDEAALPGVEAATAPAEAAPARVPAWISSTAQQVAEISMRADPAFVTWSATLQMDPATLPATELRVCFSHDLLSLRFRTQSTQSAHLICTHRQELISMLKESACMPKVIEIEFE